ncbi:MAG: general secretion pathway protein GspK [Opitutae bacterium]|nr:general secretion pathway protein GspK [Opitutae bacterium]
MSTHRKFSPLHSHRATRGAVLVMVLWIVFGLVALTLYFANSMSSELRAADNRVAQIAAEEAVAGGARYVEFILSQFAVNGAVPVATDYSAEAVPVGDCYFWIIGRDPNLELTDQPFFGIVDESSKINLKNASQSMLESLPGMTPEFAAAILDWHDTDSNPREGGAEDDVYARLDPPRLCKNAAFETVDELRLVYGSTLDLLYGEDGNRNGVLDRNEDDGEQSLPFDDRNGVLNPGLFEYVTVYSAQPNTRSDGSRRVNVTDSTEQGRQRLRRVLSDKLNPGRADEIINRIGNIALTSVLEFIVLARLTAEEYAQIRTDISASASATVSGLINVATASETVLASIPGIGPEKAPSIIAYRQANPDNLASLVWVAEVLGDSDARRAGRYLTDQSYLFSADIAAVGRSGRGYARVKFVFDMSKGKPRIVYRQDLSALGWGLGATVRETLKQAKETWQ